MDGVRFDGSEIRALARTLDLSEKSVQKKAADVVRKAAFAVERGAKVRAPVDTGNLRNSINTVLSVRGDSISAVVGAEASYGLFIEMGTWKMGPQPFLGPAFDEVEPDFIAAVEALGGQALG